MSKHIDLAKKLKALADRGIDGEKTTAEKMLADLMRKHRITDADIEGEKEDYYFFQIEDGEDRLWSQIVAVVNTEIGKWGPFTIKEQEEMKKLGQGIVGNYSCKCTAAEYIQIEGMLSVYLPLFKSEYEVFLNAFCMANNLLITDAKSKTRDDVTPEEYKEYMRARRMSAGIRSEKFRKQITG